MEFKLSQSDENLTSHSGLALVGRLLDHTQLCERLNVTQLPTGSSYEISNAEVASSYLGLLTQGKSDFDHVEPFREDPFFAKALSCDRIPSAPTLRQRLEQFSNGHWVDIIREESAAMLSQMGVTLTPALRGMIPLDGDVSPFDNSGTHKEGVERTYKQVDGYAPIFFYLGKEGYLVNQELRRGSTHSQAGTTKLLEKTVGLARQITAKTLLIRLDAAHDSVENLYYCHKTPKVECIIKHNLRTESLQFWHLIARALGNLKEPRPGKKVWTGSVSTEAEYIGENFPINVVFRVTERTIDKDGQRLLIPELQVDVWYTTLPDPAKTIIRLYKEHATCEQFHSEIKTELDLERLPSGKFNANSLVLAFGMLAYNMLRLIGQISLELDAQPTRKKVHRRRIRTVIQNLIMLAARLVYHARSWKLNFGKHSPWFHTFQHIYFRFT